jgi:hypothetical protein
LNIGYESWLYNSKLRLKYVIRKEERYLNIISEYFLFAAELKMNLVTKLREENGEFRCADEKNTKLKMHQYL